MKSVSFSDLWDSSGMDNFDSNVKKSSSIKQLTHYNSSEDILRRFSTKTAEKCMMKEFNNVDESNIESATYTKINDFPFQNYDTNIKLEIQTNQEKTIKELRDQLRDKNNFIARLQDENLLLKTESTKNSEQVKILESRIKYLEHTLDSFQSNGHNRNSQTNFINENVKIENNDSFNDSYSNSQTSMKSRPLFSRVNFDLDNEIEEEKTSTYSKNRFSNDSVASQDKTIDLRQRPNSADSKLQNSYTINSHENEMYNQSRYPFAKLYDSDSEPNSSHKVLNRHSRNENQTSTSLNYINIQRQRLDRDRSMNLSEFKSRLDEFTKLARKSTEQNSLRNSTSSLPQTSDYKSTQKYDNYDKSNDFNIKNRLKLINHSSRPPINPSYKQRKGTTSEIKVGNEQMTNYSLPTQSAITEDIFLKERLKKILDKHNYPVNNSYYKNQNDGINSDVIDDAPNTFSYKKYGITENNKSVELVYPNLPVQYKTSFSNRAGFCDSNIPRLDLTSQDQPTFCSDDSTDLLEKYLNYTNIS